MGLAASRCTRIAPAGVAPCLTPIRPCPPPSPTRPEAAVGMAMSGVSGGAGASRVLAGRPVMAAEDRAMGGARAFVTLVPFRASYMGLVFMLPGRRPGAARQPLRRERLGVVGKRSTVLTLQQGGRGLGRRARRRGHDGGAVRPAAAPLSHRQHPGQQLPDEGTPGASGVHAAAGGRRRAAPGRCVAATLRQPSPDALPAAGQPATRCSAHLTRPERSAHH